MGGRKWKRNVKMGRGRKKLYKKGKILRKKLNHNINKIFK